MVLLKDGITALMLAAEKGRILAVDLLLAYNAQVDLKNKVGHLFLYPLRLSILLKMNSWE